MGLDNFDFMCYPKISFRYRKHSHLPHAHILVLVRMGPTNQETLAKSILLQLWNRQKTSSEVLMGTTKGLICGRRISIKSTKSWSRVFTHNLWKPVEVLEAILISPQQTFCHIPWQLETSVPIAMKALKMIPCWKSISRITTRAFSREALEFVLRDPKYVDWLN